MRERLIIQGVVRDRERQPFMTSGTDHAAPSEPLRLKVEQSGPPVLRKTVKSEPSARYVVPLSLGDRHSAGVPAGMKSGELLSQPATVAKYFHFAPSVPLLLSATRDVHPPALHPSAKAPLINMSRPPDFSF